MSIEVSGISRPARPALAVVVTAILLALTISGAAWLTFTRNQPIALGQVHRVEGIGGVLIAWPEGWVAQRLSVRSGAPLIAVAEKQDQAAQRILILAARQVADEAVAPEQAATALLDSAARQLNFKVPPQKMARAEGTLAGLPAVQVQLRVRYQEEVYWLEIRAVSQENGRAVGLLMLSPEQFTPTDARIMDAVSESMELTQSSPSNRLPPADADTLSGSMPI